MLISTINRLLIGNITLKECVQLYEKNIITIYKNGTSIITKEEV